MHPLRKPSHHHIEFITSTTRFHPEHHVSTQRSRATEAFLTWRVRHRLSSAETLVTTRESSSPARTTQRARTASRSLAKNRAISYHPWYGVGMSIRARHGYKLLRESQPIMNLGGCVLSLAWFALPASTYIVNIPIT